MKLTDHIQQYKTNHKNTTEHVFKDGSKFKGGYGIKLHEFLDKAYNEALSEFKTNGTKNTVIWIQSLINC